ncbi:MAG: hypothetical protein ABIA75_07885 [Candidatus Neomarinimicrobiota bacterium]
MNLRARITLGFIVVILIMLVASGVIIWNQSLMQQSFSNLAATIDLERYLLECRRHEKNFLLRNDQSYVLIHRANYDSLTVRIALLRPEITDPKIQAKLTELKASLVEYQSIFTELATHPAAVIATDPILAARLEQEVQKARDSHDLIGQIRLLTTERFHLASSVGHLVNIGSILVGILVAVIIAGFLTDKIIQFIDQDYV